MTKSTIKVAKTKIQAIPPKMAATKNPSLCEMAAMAKAKKVIPVEIGCKMRALVVDLIATANLTSVEARARMAVGS